MAGPACRVVRAHDCVRLKETNDVNGAARPFDGNTQNVGRAVFQFTRPGAQTTLLLVSLAHGVLAIYHGDLYVATTGVLGLTRSGFIEDLAPAALLPQISAALKKIEASSAG